MELKYSELANMLSVCFDGLKDISKIDNKYIGFLNQLEVLSKTKTISDVIFKYKTFKTSLEFENWQNENIVFIHSISPIYNNFETNEIIEETQLKTEIELNIMVTYYTLNNHI